MTTDTFMAKFLELFNKDLEIYNKGYFGIGTYRKIPRCIRKFGKRFISAYKDIVDKVGDSIPCGRDTLSDMRNLILMATNCDVAPGTKKYIEEDYIGTEIYSCDWDDHIHSEGYDPDDPDDDFEPWEETPEDREEEITKWLSTDYLDQEPLEMACAAGESFCLGFAYALKLATEIIESNDKTS